MTVIALSDDLIEISAEINVFKQQAGQAVFEIGKRLKHVKENDLARGQWVAWLESVDISRQTATRFIQAYEQFGNGTAPYHLGVGKIFEMLSLPESIDRQEFISKTHLIPSTGEEKMVSEMKDKELREVKKALQEAERRANKAEEKATIEKNSAIHFEKLFNSVKNQPPRVETRVVEKVPDDYNDLQEQSRVAQQLNSENVKLKRDLMQQRQEYEERLTKEDRRKAINKDLGKACKELMQNHAMFAETIIYNLSMSGGEREAAQIIESFSVQYSNEVQSFFNRIKQLTAIRAAN